MYSFGRSPSRCEKKAEPSADTPFRRDMVSEQKRPQRSSSPSRGRQTPPANEEEFSLAEQPRSPLEAGALPPLFRTFETRDGEGTQEGGGPQEMLGSQERARVRAGEGNRPEPGGEGDERIRDPAKSKEHSGLRKSHQPRMGDGQFKNSDQGPEGRNPEGSSSLGADAYKEGTRRPR